MTNANAISWPSVFLLSLFGFVMALGTVFIISSNLEPLCWFVIFIYCAFVIARNVERPFLHGLLVGLVNSIWVTGAHIFFFNRYIATHTREAAMTASMPAPPKVMMMLIGPMVGLISGMMMGMLACILVRRTRSL